MKRTLTSDEVINEIAETLREGDGDFIEQIANQVLTPEVTYKEDSIFEQDTGDEPKDICSVCQNPYPANTLSDINETDFDLICDDCKKEQTRRDEKNGLYPDKWDDAN